MSIVKVFLILLLTVLGITSLLYSLMSLEVITFTPRIYLITSFNVGNSSISLNGFGYGLEIAGDRTLDLDIMRRLIWAIEFRYTYLGFNGSSVLLNRYLTSSYDHLPLHEFSFRDYVNVVSRLCGDLGGYLIVTVHSLYTALITGLKELGPNVEELYLAKSVGLLMLKIPVVKVGNELILLYNKTTYELSSFRLRDGYIRCSDSYCGIYVNLVSTEYSPVRGEVTYTPTRAMNYSRTSSTLLIVTSAILIAVAVALAKVHSR